MTSTSKEITRRKTRTDTRDEAATASARTAPMRFARTAADEYAAMENGYHAKLRDFLRRAYHSYELCLQTPEGFEELKRDPFWQNSRQKPKVLNSSKWVLYFIMRATQSNGRARASKYARILDGLDREEVHVTEAANRIAKLGGVEAAYKRMVAAERGRAVSGAAGDDEEMESEECLIPRRSKLRASGEDDAKAHGEAMSPSQMNIDRAAGGRRPMPSYDPNRFLFVGLGAAELKRVLDAGTKAKGPVRFRLEITAYPRKAGGIPRVVGDRVSSIEPTRNAWAGRKGSTHLKEKSRQMELRRRRTGAS
jgi:hypothetical protein